MRLVLLSVLGGCLPHTPPPKTVVLDDVSIVPSNVPLRTDREYVRDSRKQVVVCETAAATVDINTALTNLVAGADALVQIVTQRRVETTWKYVANVGMVPDSTRVCYDLSAVPIRYLPQGVP